MRTTVILALLMVVVGVGGIAVGELDDAPGAALIGLLLIAGAVVLVVRKARRRG